MITPPTVCRQCVHNEHLSDGGLISGQSQTRDQTDDERDLVIWRDARGGAVGGNH